MSIIAHQPLTSKRAFLRVQLRSDYPTHRSIGIYSPEHAEKLYRWANHELTGHRGVRVLDGMDFDSLSNTERLPEEARDE
jgi:hypothetical protein